MAKKVIGNLKLRIPGGKATAGPPVGSTLGQWGLNMMDFINPFNEATKEFMGKNVIVLFGPGFRRGRSDEPSEDRFRGEGSNQPQDLYLHAGRFPGPHASHRVERRGNDHGVLGKRNGGRG